MEVEVSIIIVNWNGDDCLKNTVSSLYEFTRDVSFEVIIIDNASNSQNASYKFLLEEAKEFNNLKVIFNSKNLGFAKANNIGINISKGKYILLLNPDVILQNNATRILAGYLDKHSDIGIIGPKVLNPDGSFQYTCMRGIPNPIDVFYTLCGLSKLFRHNSFFNKFSLFHLDNNKIQDISGLSGCCMMIRKSLINKIGNLDEEFFLYQEETDLCYRALKSGWRIVYNPDALVEHNRGYTCKKSIFRTNYIFCASMARFFKKHYFLNYNPIQRGMFTFLIWLNFFVRITRFILNYEIKPVNLQNLVNMNLNEQINEDIDRGWLQPAK